MLTILIACLIQEKIANQHARTKDVFGLVKLVVILRLTVISTLILQTTYPLNASQHKLNQKNVFPCFTCDTNKQPFNAAHQINQIHAHAKTHSHNANLCLFDTISSTLN